MSTNTINWSTLITDPASATSVSALETLAAGLDPQVPAVLIPIRVETRFTTVEVPSLVDHLGELVGHLNDIATLLQRLARLPFTTELTGTVRQQRRFKETVEAPLYDQIQTSLDELTAELD